MAAKEPPFAIYKAMLPQPTRTSSRRSQQPMNNYYQGGQPDTPKSSLYAVRVDYNMSNNTRFFVRGNGNRFAEGTFDWTYEAPDAYKRLHDGFRKRYSWSFTGNGHARDRPDGHRQPDLQQPVLPAGSVHRTGELQAVGFRSPHLHGRLLHGARRVQIARSGLWQWQLSVDVEQRQRGSDDHQPAGAGQSHERQGVAYARVAASTSGGPGARPSRAATRQDPSPSTTTTRARPIRRRISRRRRISDCLWRPSCSGFLRQSRLHSSRQSA